MRFAFVAAAAAGHPSGACTQKQATKTQQMWQPFHFWCFACNFMTGLSQWWLFGNYTH